MVIINMSVLKIDSQGSKWSPGLSECWVLLKRNKLSLMKLRKVLSTNLSSKGAQILKLRIKPISWQNPKL